MNNNKKKISSFIISLVIGSLIGAGVALLMAPQSGDKTRALIKDKSNELRGKALVTAENTRDRAEKTLGDLSNTTRERANELMKRGQSLVGN